jgi:Spy/CpxP family protein refolding chaperone
MNRKKTLLVVALAVLVGAVFFAGYRAVDAWASMMGGGFMAGPHGPGGHGVKARKAMLEHRLARIELMENLNLTDEQKMRFREMLRDNRGEIKPLVREIMAQKRALMELVTAEFPDEAAILSQADRMSEAIGRAAVEASRLAREARLILTPDQIKMIEEFREDQHGKGAELLGHFE